MLNEHVFDSTVPYQSTVRSGNNLMEWLGHSIDKLTGDGFNKQ
ncbi:MAG: hypothetical protein J07AB43_01430 [Candidatus Nanosalina sp. J07AB43]|nr:MAG: hypothetical protein J07AB43_01430 [Candidatus Nanosalina sp. J07AB43]